MIYVKHPDSLVEVCTHFSNTHQSKKSIWNPPFWLVGGLKMSAPLNKKVLFFLLWYTLAHCKDLEKKGRKRNQCMLSFNDNFLYLTKVKGSEKSPYSIMQMHKLRKIGT
jgi:hypothetical protein